MIARQVGIVLCRVGAAVLTVQAIRSLGYTLPSFVYGDNQFSSEVIALSLLTVLPGLAAIGLWVFAERICSVVVSVESSANPEPLTGIDLVRIGTALIGMYLAISAVIYGVNIEVTNLARPDLGAERQTMMDEHAARIIGMRASYVVQLTIGLALLIGRNRISTMLAKAKYAGVDTG